MLRTLALAMAASLLACRPDLGPSDSLVSSVRVLAVRATPPEAKPGTHATYEALVVGPEDDGAAPLLWRWCRAPKPLAENNVVSPSCLEASSLSPAGFGMPLDAVSPVDACSLFGPDTPPGGFRPRDADETGGYYAPLRLDVDGVAPAFYLARIVCNLAEAPTDVASQLAHDYVPNANPHLASIVARVDGNEVTLDAVRVNAAVVLEASWSAEDAETFVYFDRESQVLSTQRESMRVAWHATSGRFETESTGRAADDRATTTDDVWTAPTAPGEVRIWVVLRDSRGGVDFASRAVQVVP